MTNSELAHELNLQLIRTRRAFRQTVQRMLREHNIEMTFEMLQVMHNLWQQQGITQQRLADITSKDKASLTNLINNLVKKGWVMRRADDSDRRNRLIYLTPEGESLSGMVRPVLNGIYDKAGERMDAEQMRLCKDCLKELNDIYNEV